jgi:hypothetical protein
MEVGNLKEEIKNLKQDVYRVESQISVHAAVKNGNETILQAPTKDTLQNMYAEMYTLIGVPEKNEKINPIFDIITNNKISESSRIETDLPGWLERLENKKREKSCIRKPARAKPPRKPTIPETPPDVPLLSPRSNEMIVDTPSRLRQSKDQKQHISTTKKSRSGKLSTSKEQKDQSPMTQSLKRIGEIGGEEHRVPFAVPLWKKRRAKVQMGVEELSEYCQKVLQIFLDHPLSWPFLAPVDVVALAIPDYLNVIKQPMDLGTISKRLNDQEYKRIEDFVEDVRLVWKNCKRYNNETLDIHKSAQTLEALFEEKLEPIMIYVDNNAPLLKNENLQKSINMLQQHHSKLMKQQQLAQANQMKPKQPHFVDASPASLSRAEVPTTAPLLPEENIILAEDVIKLEMKYMKGLFQIISEDSPHLLKTDAPIVEVNLGNLDSITIRRVVQYIEDCRTDRRLRKNQSRRKHRESKAQTPTHNNNTRLSASGNSQQRGNSRGNRNSQYSRQTQVNSESQSENTSSEESDSDSEDNAPRRSRNRPRDSYNQSRAPTTQNVPLSNSGFEMGGDETPGLTDFQNSGWIGEDADPLYRSYEPGFDGQVPKPTGGSSVALWEEFPTLGNNQPQQKKKEPFESKPKKDRSDEKSKREEKRRQNKAAANNNANNNNNNNATTNVAQSNKGYDGSGMLPPTGTPTPYGGGVAGAGYGAMNPAMATAQMYPGMYGNMGNAGYGMYGGMYGMATPGNTAGATATGAAVGVGAKQPMSAYQYQYYQQQAYAYQQQYYQQQQQYYQQAASAGALLGTAGVLPNQGVVQGGVVGFPGVVVGGAIPQGAVVGTLPVQQQQQIGVLPQTSPVPVNTQGGVATAVPQKQPIQQTQPTLPGQQ